MTEISEEYLSLLQQISELCDAMVAGEQDKRHALLKSNEDDLAAVLQTQQAALMHLESLEKQRTEKQKALGFGTLTASEIEKQLPQGETRDRFAALSAALREKASMLKELNEVSLSIAQDQLAFIQQLTETQPDAAGAAAAYGPGANKHTAASRPLFEEKV